MRKGCGGAYNNLWSGAVLSHGASLPLVPGKFGFVFLNVSGRAASLVSGVYFSGRWFKTIVICEVDAVILGAQSCNLAGLVHPLWDPGNCLGSLGVPWGPRAQQKGPLGIRSSIFIKFGALRDSISKLFQQFRVFVHACF